MKKISQAENTKRSRSILTIEIIKTILSKYPAKWRSEEISIMLGANPRTVLRILKLMIDNGLIEQKHSSYTISLNLIEQLYGAKWALQQEVNKAIMLQSKKNNKGDNNDKTKK